jgi:hypothetical protein
MTTKNSRDSRFTLARIAGALAVCGIFLGPGSAMLVHAADEKSFRANVVDTSGNRTTLIHTQFEHGLLGAYTHLSAEHRYIPIKYLGGYLKIPFQRLSRVERVAPVEKPTFMAGFGVDEDSIIARVVLRDGSAVEGNIQDVPDLRENMSIGGVSIHGQPFKIRISDLQSLSIEEIKMPPRIPHASTIAARPNYATIQTRAGDELGVGRPEIFWMSNEDGIDWFLLAGQGEEPRRMDINRIASIEFRHVEVRITDYSIRRDEVLSIQMRDGTMIEGISAREWAIGGVVAQGTFVVPFDKINRVKFLHDK